MVDVEAHKQMPFGDGNASGKIADALKNYQA
jgi:UDP-N-acetylglucosamine 2-epimerase